jgi:hypothetical protein
MPRQKKPFVVYKRKDWKTFIITLNTSSGLPDRVCREWYRKSFQNLPAELATFRNPNTIPAAEAGAFALIEFLKNRQKEGGTIRVSTEDITVGAWLKKFTTIDTSPRTGINASKNRPYSPDTLLDYKSYYDCHVKDDPIVELKMADIEEEDVLEYMSRLSVKKITAQ